MTEKILIAGVTVLVTAAIVSQLIAWAWNGRLLLPFSRKPKGPHISTDLPCPACGNRGCKLAYDAVEQKVKRCCNTCGCIVTQPPVEPKLFENK